jgi:hypothetical protein
VESDRWYREPAVWLELFVIANQAGLAPDIWLAHQSNHFRKAGEVIPLVFSLIAPPVLLAALVAWRWRGAARAWRTGGMMVGLSSIAVGVVGLVWHLDSRFFVELTLESLVYTAPFAAPLAYTALGLMLLLNRMVASRDASWSDWVLVMAVGGFVGNFVFSLADHAQNGFFHATEWIPVAASAYAVAFLSMPLLMRVRQSYRDVCAVVLAAQVAVGVLGFGYHVMADLHGPSSQIIENFVYGTPSLAPLLFVDLSLLAALALIVRPWPE